VFVAFGQQASQLAGALGPGGAVLGAVIALGTAMGLVLGAGGMMLAAPLIVRRPEEAAADRQEVVMFLHDFSFRTPQEVLAEIDRFLASKGLRGRTIKYGIYDAIEEVWETADRSVEVRLRAYHQGDLYMYVELWDKDYVDDEVDPETSMSFGPSDAEAVISWLSRTLRMIR
jgi:hypothetical protein